MTDAFKKGSLTVGITIPPDLRRHCLWAHSPVQALYDAVDANTANIASSYINQLVSDYNFASTEQPPLILLVPSYCATLSKFRPLSSTIQGLRVPGMIGVVLTIVGSQTASSLREKQRDYRAVMMTPASNTEIILAKVCPLLVPAQLRCRELLCLWKAGL